MLHIPSYNMGLAAGVAWKSAGQQYFNLSDFRPDEESGRVTFIESILEKSEVMTIFLPSSFFEGFYNAFVDHTSHNFIKE